MASIGKRKGDNYGAPPEKKSRSVKVATFDKWVADNDKELSTTTWLELQRSKEDRDVVECLKCKLCTRFESRICGSKNFSNAYIVGSRNVKTSSFKDHAASEMHRRAMDLYLKDQPSCATLQNAPIVQALTKMDQATATKVGRKFEIAYLLCKEHMAFSKMEVVCQLEERHGVDLGTGRKNEKTCATFVDYIGQSLKEQLKLNLKNAIFFSVQTDGSNDAANIEEELYVALYCDTASDDGRIHVRSEFMGVKQPRTVDAAGLLECLQRALSNADLSDWQQ